jgi:predicted RNA binding protein YcfA (HicA-like mRNA interferase family)
VSEKRRDTENYQKVLDGRTAISFRDFERLLVSLGFVLKRQSGSHRIYGHPKAERSFPIQPEGHDAERYQVRQLRDMIARYGLRLNQDR